MRQLKNIFLMLRRTAREKMRASGGLPVQEWESLKAVEKQDTIHILQSNFSFQEMPEASSISASDFLTILLSIMSWENMGISGSISTWGLTKDLMWIPVEEKPSIGRNIGANGIPTMKMGASYSWKDRINVACAGRWQKNGTWNTYILNMAGARQDARCAWDGYCAIGVTALHSWCSKGYFQGYLVWSAGKTRGMVWCSTWLLCTQHRFSVIFVIDSLHQTLQKIK
jgi:hypothetical protein